MNDTNRVTAFESYLLTEKRVSQNTFLSYQKDIEQLISFFAEKKVSLQDVTKVHLKNYLKRLNRKGIAPRSVARKISSIKLFFLFLNEQYGFANRAESLLFPKIEKTLPVYLSQREIEKLFKILAKDETPKGVRNRVMISLLYATGVRISELLSITVNDIHFDTGFIQVMGKGNKERSIPIPLAMLKLMREYINDVYPVLIPQGKKTVEGHLFVSWYGKQVKPLTRQLFWMQLKKLLTIAGIDKPISPHSFRHSLATHLLKNGADLRSLQLLLGHENLSTIQIYTHLETSGLRRVYDKKHPRS